MANADSSIILRMVCFLPLGNVLTSVVSGHGAPCNSIAFFNFKHCILDNCGAFQLDHKRHKRIIDSNTASTTHHHKDIATNAKSFSTDTAGCWRRPPVLLQGGRTWYCAYRGEPCTLVGVAAASSAALKSGRGAEESRRSIRDIEAF